MEDVEGLYTGLCSKRGRAKCGGCPWCETEGVWLHKKVTYPGAVTFTPVKDPLRKKYKKEFESVPGYQDLHNKPRPKKMTLSSCQKSAKNVLEAKEETKVAYEEAKAINPYIDHDITSELLEDYNKLNSTCVDPYHEYGNLCNDMRCLIFNIEKTGQHWKKSRRDLEHQYGRFLHITGTTAGWHVTEESVGRVQDYVKTLKVPIGWPGLKAFCVRRKEKKKYMKLSERLGFFSDRGVYIMGTYSIYCNIDLLYI
jgi:hypothetical protein